MSEFVLSPHEYCDWSVCQFSLFSLENEEMLFIVVCSGN